MRGLWTSISRTLEGTGAGQTGTEGGNIHWVRFATLQNWIPLGPLILRGTSKVHVPITDLGIGGVGSANNGAEGHHFQGIMYLK